MSKKEIEVTPSTRAIVHADMVAALAKSGYDIMDTMTEESLEVWHMATGISGEAGELLDAIKKVVIYNKPVDRANVIEELGDLEFYMEGLRQLFGVTREETLEYNKAKLSVRYGEAYSDEAAQARADKTDGE